MKRLLVLATLIVITLSGAAVMHSSDLGELIPGTSKSIIDMHVHVAGLGYGDSGCFINTDMRNNVRFPVILRAMDVTEEELEQHGDRIIFEKLSSRIAASEMVDKAVILAMDGYVTEEGVFDKNQTQIYVPNDYIARETAHIENLVYGASINPNRKDAIERLRAARRDGAVLVKWIPSIMKT